MQKGHECGESWKEPEGKVLEVLRSRPMGLGTRESVSEQGRLGPEARMGSQALSTWGRGETEIHTHRGRERPREREIERETER